MAVLIKDDEGKEMILSYLNQGDFLGEMGMFEENENPSAPPGFARKALAKWQRSPTRSSAS